MMRSIVRTSLLTLALLGAAAGSGAAQEMRMMRPEPLDPNSPRGQQAAELVQVLLTGDANAAVAHLTEHGAPALGTPEAIATTVRRVLDEIGTDGSYLIGGLDQAGAEAVVIRLQHTGDGPGLGLLIGMEAAAPHRITELRPIRIQIRMPEPGGDR